MSKYIAIIVGVLILLFVTVQPAKACVSVAIGAPSSTSVEEADVIFSGKVLWTRPGLFGSDSVTVFKVHKKWKGKVGKKIKVYQNRKFSCFRKYKNGKYYFILATKRNGKLRPNQSLVNYGKEWPQNP